MYNTQRPGSDELPSTQRLLVSTAIALVTAGIILITAILPAEYGVDPTGIGKALGLTQMGEIKTQLAEEAAQEAMPSPAAPTEVAQQEAVANAPDAATATTAPESVKEEVTPTPVETMQVTLAPGDAAEIKAAMLESATVTYSWSVDTGHVNFDNHGDNKSTKYHNYTKGKAVKADQGEITAAFDGKHGWYWRNRSTETVTVTLNVSGEYSSLKRVL